MDTQRVAVIIEDDKDICDLLSAVLQQSGFEVYAASNGSDGVEAVQMYSPTVVTLDLGLADIDGFEVIRQLRLFSDAYIMMLTARAEELDTLMGLEAGADDYITKPLRPRELRARISAMLRRPRSGEDSYAGGDGVTKPAAADAIRVHAAPTYAAEPLWEVAKSNADDRADGRFRHNGRSLDFGTRTTEIDSKAVDLTRTEFELLHAVMESGGQVRTKTDLVPRLLLR